MMLEKLYSLFVLFVFINFVCIEGFSSNGRYQIVIRSERKRYIVQLAKIK